jgi:hypothetical protein
MKDYRKDKDSIRSTLLLGDLVCISRGATKNAFTTEEHGGNTEAHRGFQETQSNPE